MNTFINIFSYLKSFTIKKEKYDVYKHHHQYIWKWNQLQRFSSQNEIQNTHGLATTAKLSLNGDETTTANAPDRSSRAHACQCEFTSGSRPGSSGPAILRSLFLGRTLLRFHSRVQCRAVFAIEAFSRGTCPIRGRGVMQRNIGCRSLYWDELECSRAR